MVLHAWLAFFVAAWLISLSPGAGAVSCMAAGMRYGCRRAFWNFVGLQLGILLVPSVVAAVSGAILAAPAVAFTTVRWMGALYLIYLAVLPQFIDTVRPQFILCATCGATLFFTDAVVMSGHTSFASSVLTLLRGENHRWWMNRSFGAMFVAAGEVLATFKRVA